MRAESDPIKTFLLQLQANPHYSRPPIFLLSLPFPPRSLPPLLSNIHLSDPPQHFVSLQPPRKFVHPIPARPSRRGEEGEGRGGEEREGRRRPHHELPRGLQLNLLRPERVDEEKEDDDADADDDDDADIMRNGAAGNDEEIDTDRLIAVMLLRRAES
eukprot:624769-Hanusia_phi.AAC.1